MAMITGNTFPVKDQLRAMGGKWNPRLKGWDVPESMVEKAQALVASKSQLRSGYQPRTCQTCSKKINYGTYCGKCEYS